jgi:hypothetical protein
MSGAGTLMPKGIRVRIRRIREVTRTMESLRVVTVMPS